MNKELTIKADNTYYGEEIDNPYKETPNELR